MAHRPVCVKCEVEMRPEKNGVTVIDTEKGEATQLWGASSPVSGISLGHLDPTIRLVTVSTKRWAS